MNFVTEVMMSEIQQASHLMRSVEADLEGGTWTFSAPYFRAGAGEYLIISKHDWEQIKQRFSPERSPTSREIPK